MSQDSRTNGNEISKWKDKCCGCGPATEIVQLYDDNELFRQDYRKKRCAGLVYVVPSAYSALVLLTPRKCCPFFAVCCPWGPRRHTVIVKRTVSSYHDEARSWCTILRDSILGIFPCIAIPAYVTVFSSSVDEVEILMKHKYATNVMAMFDQALQNYPSGGGQMTEVI